MNPWMKRLIHLVICFVPFLQIQAQDSLDNSDEGYRKPLKEVLDDIQKRYDVQIKYADTMVNNKWVSYAEWRFRPDVETTLDNVLRPLDMRADQ